MKTEYHVIIIGGSYAGLSAAMSLGRSLRNVLVIDSGQPCNTPTPHSQNFLTQDGNTPTAISAIAHAQVESYKTVTFVDGLAIRATGKNKAFEVEVESSQIYHGKKLIFATGIKDQFPEIKGLKACWGKTVIHCPYCHGYEHQGVRTAILASGETAMHYALLVSNLTKDLTILTNGSATFSEEELAKLKTHHIPVIDTPVTEIAHTNGNVSEVAFRDGTKLPFQAIYFRPEFTQHTDLPMSLGCELTDQGYLKIDPMQKTNIDGVFACGDNSSMMRAVAHAVATGNFAGAVVNRELAAESF
jgi:thioredoxin reductase